MISHVGPESFFFLKVQFSNNFLFIQGPGEKDRQRYRSRTTCFQCTSSHHTSFLLSLDSVRARYSLVICSLCREVVGSGRKDRRTKEFSRTSLLHLVQEATISRDSALPRCCHLLQSIITKNSALPHFCLLVHALFQGTQS
jgi:hypothetical protein